MYVILPLYGLSIPADEENALFSFQEPKNRGTLRPSKATKPFLPEKQCKYALSWCISALAWTFGIRTKKRAGIKPARGLRFAECGFSFSPEGWQKLFIALALKIIHIIHISGYADMQKVFVRLYTTDIVADFR